MTEDAAVCPEEDPEIKKLQESLDFLPEGEQILSSHRVGFNTVVLTDERIIVLRRFPSGFVDVKYEDIRAVEHTSPIDISKLIKAVIFLTIGLYAYVNIMPNPYASPSSAFINRLLQDYFPELVGLLPIGMILELAVILILGVALSMFLEFIDNSGGRLRILQTGHAPLQMRTSLNPTVRNLIKHLKAQMAIEHGDRQIPTQTQPLNIQPEPVPFSPTQRIAMSLTDVSPTSILVVSADSGDHLDVISSAVETFVKKNGYGCLYVSISRPYEQLTLTLESKGIPTKEIQFIDCISTMAGKKPETRPANAIFIDNPGNLEEVSLYMDKTLAKIKNEKKVVILDSITSFLIYNNPRSVEEFTHQLISKIRLASVAGIILNLHSKDSDELVRTLIPMCDKEISV
ncbi:Uncharacterised protein [uncultured archaeon]|nr:Uncharacterised protein [uncultured archaeon]